VRRGGIRDALKELAASTVAEIGSDHEPGLGGDRPGS
jgi:hypothetical protein